MKRRKADRIKGKREHGIITVKCQFNTDYHGWLLVDTGSVMTVLSKSMATQIGLDLANPTRWMEISSIHKTDRAPVIRLDTFQVGGQKIDDLDVMVLTLPVNLRIDGLLGVNFLRKFRVAFEFDQATLILRQAK